MKLHITEAGYRVPGIIRWPGHTKPGSIRAEPVCSVDLLPTACALAGIEPPRDRPLDGANLLPLFENQPLQRPHPLYWQYELYVRAEKDSPLEMGADPARHPIRQLLGGANLANRCDQFFGTFHFDNTFDRTVPLGASQGRPSSIRRSQA